MPRRDSHPLNVVVIRGHGQIQQGCEANEAAVLEALGRLAPVVPLDAEWSIKVNY